MIGSLNLLTNSMNPEAQPTIHTRKQFSADPNRPHNQYSKQVTKHLKGTATQGLILRNFGADGTKWRVRILDQPYI